jgi:hypothetical protein
MKNKSSGTAAAAMRHSSLAEERKKHSPAAPDQAEARKPGSQANGNGHDGKGNGKGRAGDCN